MATSSGIQFSTKLDDKRLRADFAKLRFRDQFRAGAAALNIVRTGIRTDLKSEVANRFPIINKAPKKRAASRIRLPGGSGKATWQRPIAVSVQLFKFVPKIWSFPDGMKPQSIGNGEFIQIMSNSYVGVFKQKPGGKRTKNGKARITQVLMDNSDISERKLVEVLTKAGTVRWPNAFRNQAKRYISKSSGGL